jgi:acetyltransferase-like isoleucine patch superfamily enzyme
VLYGASIGKQIAIGGKILDPFATRLDDHAVLGEDSIVTAHIMTHDRFYLLPVTVKKWATVGVGVIIMPGVEVGENSVVLPGSVVTMRTQIPSNEIWGGIPARKIKDVDTSDVRS